MMIPLLLLLSVVGVVLNLSFSATLVQPDWALAFLLAALLSHRGYWRWVLPAIWLHDLTLHWSSFAFLPLFLWIPLILIWIDEQLGPALPQRLTILVIATLPMLWLNWGIAAWLLTCLLCICVWYMMTRMRLEPA